MNKKLLYITLASYILATTSRAGPVNFKNYSIAGDDVKHNTNIYAGIKIALDSKPAPILVLGLFDTHVKQNGDTQGVNLAVHIKVLGGISLSRMKLSYLNGKNDLQGEVGGGYDLSKHAPFSSLGLNAPFAAIDVDGFSLHDLQPSLTIHSQDEFKESTKSCQFVGRNFGIFRNANCT